MSRTIDIGIQRLTEEVSMPYSKYGDNAGWDVFVTEKTVLPPMGVWYKEKPIPGEMGFDEVEIEHFGSAYPVKVPLNMKVAIPEGYYMMITGRSGLTSKGIICGTGTIDAGYRGQVFATLINLTDKPVILEKGERVAQAIIFEYIKPNWVERIIDESETERGSTGFGDSGRF